MQISAFKHSEGASLTSDVQFQPKYDIERALPYSLSKVDVHRVESNKAKEDSDVQVLDIESKLIKMKEQLKAELLAYLSTNGSIISTDSALLIPDKQGKNSYKFLSI